MSIVFSPSQAAFLDTELQSVYEAAGTWPSDVVAVDKDTWLSFIGGSPMGKVLGADNLGNPTWIDAPPLDVPKALARLNALAGQKETAGVYFQPASASQPVLFGTDVSAQQRTTSAYLLAGAGLWTTGAKHVAADGTAYVFTATEIAALAQKAGSYVLACSQRAIALQSDIQADPTTDITVGWPSQT